MADSEGIDGFLDFRGYGSWRRLELPRGEGPGSPGALEALAREAFGEIAFRLPVPQLEGFASILADPDAGEGERFVAASLIRNAAIAAEGIYPLCQDTGVAVVHGWRGTAFGHGATRGPSAAEDGDEAALSRGAARAYREHRLRASVLAPSGFVPEANTGDNLPVHCDLRSSPGGLYRLCFSAKGGGSSNRTVLSMESPALLDRGKLEARLAALVRGLGTSGCPPYRITCVLGGLSPDESLRALALAGLGLLDNLPSPSGGTHGALRDTDWEGVILAAAAATGWGAQFGGRHLALDARAVRLPRHAASLPLAFGVTCAAGRRARAVIDADGAFLEPLEADPARFLPGGMPLFEGALRIDLSRPMAELARELGGLAPGTRLLLSGPVLTARDKAHARFHELLSRGEGLPPELFRHPVFYAGPTAAAPGEVSGSFGPTTAGRMDAYMEELLARGAALVTIAKGARSAAAAAAIGAAGGAYLCAIGGAAALAGREAVVDSRLVAWPELGMEALRLVTLRDLPAIVGVDGKGRDFHAAASGGSR